MRLLVDACMSRQLFEALADFGHDATWVRDWQPSATDTEIIRKARDERRAIITLDRDIPALVLRSEQSGCPSAHPAIEPNASPRSARSAASPFPGCTR